MYKLLTPGPLTTTESVKQAMMIDHCTWDDDYKSITQTIRKKLLRLAHGDPQEYTAVLMQGSGTFGVESVLTSTVGTEEKLLIVANGAYGLRMAEIAKHAGLSYELYLEENNRIPDADQVDRILQRNGDFTHVAMVHGETTSGILNDAQAVGKAAKKHGCTFILDAMSTFGGVDLPISDWDIDFLISSANKCIQGVPGFSFILARRDAMKAAKGKARSLSLDLYAQWETMEKDGKWRFTSPTHTVLAFAKALDELEQEGGVQARNKRYRDNNCLLISKMKELGMLPYIDEAYQSPIITAFYYPNDRDFSFQEMYTYIKERGYAIYPGKVTEADTFRIGNIGEIYAEDMLKLSEIIKEFLKENQDA